MAVGVTMNICHDVGGSLKWGSPAKDDKLIRTVPRHLPVYELEFQAVLRSLFSFEEGHCMVFLFTLLL